MTRSWIASANVSGADFSLLNLPWGVFDRRGEAARAGVAIGDQVLDVAACPELPRELRDAAASPWLNDLMSAPAAARREWRQGLIDLLREGSAHRERVEPHLIPAAQVRMRLPARVGDYTDFYASIFHAANVGRLFRPDNPLLPNYKWAPIGYHGRASSLVVSGTPVSRPRGQVKGEAAEPSFEPSRLLDYEVEAGIFIGPGNAMGTPVPVARAADHIFGYCLVNDWSARDVQAWEYQPLGPFLSKSFATSVSPWVVTAEALEPFGVAAMARPSGDPAPLAYLAGAADQARGALDLHLEAWLSTAAMRAAGLGPVRLSRANARDLYWTPAQLIAHHTSNGCSLRPGDLLATGTVSGPGKESRGCLLELTSRGAEPLSLPSGETRRFLEDGDEVILRGWCEREDGLRVGFGECRGLVLPAAC